MPDEFTINEPELVAYLMAIAYMCIEHDTDNCDLELNTKDGVINCHIEFSDKRGG